MTNEESSKVETMTLGNKALAKAPLPGGLIALVFFDLTSGEPRAKEVRVLSAERVPPGKELLRDWEPGEGHVPTSTLRSVPLVSMRQELMKEQAEGHEMFEAYDVKAGRKVKVPGFAFRRPQDQRAAIERAKVAIRYEELILKGEAEPTRQIGDEFFQGDTTKARNVVAAARKAGFLTSPPPGTAGGRTTKKLHEFWTALSSDPGKAHP